jgi:hypothetical protein
LPDPLDLTALICDPFFRVKPGLGRDSKGHPVVKPGQLVWAHQLYPPVRPFIIEVKGYDPRDARNNSYVVSQLRAEQATHFPIKELNLRADENLYVMYGKKRPGIVLQTLNADFYNRNSPEPYVVVAPCFTFKEKHSPNYRARVAAMEFPNLLFLPTHIHGFTQEGVVRFEHIQPVAAAGVEPHCRDGTSQCFLSDEAWAVLQHRLSMYFIGKGIDAELETALQAYHDCVIEAYENP